MKNGIVGDSGIESQLSHNQNYSSWHERWSPKKAISGNVLQPTTEMLYTPCTNPFYSANHRLYAASTPVDAAYSHYPRRRPAALPSTPAMYPVYNHHAQSQDTHQCIWRDALPTEGHEMYLLWKRTVSPQASKIQFTLRQPRRVHYDISSDSENKYATQKERIPTLRPGQFDG